MNGLQHALEARQNGRPSLGNTLDHAVFGEAFPSECQLHELAMGFKHEGDGRGTFLQGSFVKDMVERVGQTPRPVSFENFADVGGLALQHQRDR